MFALHKVRISPRKLSGNISVPPSKSDAHRAIICASLAEGKSVVGPVEMSEDIKATISCMKNLGAEIKAEGRNLYIDGRNTFGVGSAQLDCSESGSTLRFLIPVAAAGGVGAEFTGHGKLPGRPIGVYTDQLPGKGVRCETSGGLPLRIAGRLSSGIFEVPGDISSQFITGLLLALPLAEGDSEIRLTSGLQSVGYVNMTLKVMKDFGVTAETLENGWRIRGGQKYAPGSYEVEGDWSQAAFFMTAAALGSVITIDNLSLDSVQGDKECVNVYRRLGAVIEEDKGILKMSPGKLRGIQLDASDIPDMVPAFAAAAALAQGRTVITGAERLRIKESDRLRAVRDCLDRLGGDVTETPDGLIINGRESLKGGFVEGYNDHRIVMSMAAAAVACTEDVVVSDMESVRKSYPSFFEDYRRLGGKADVIMG